MPQAPEFFMGGGALYSTGRDYLTFLRMLLANGKLGTAQILKPETGSLPYLGGHLCWIALASPSTRRLHRNTQ